jgi:endo-1,4-beta-xylanase
MTSNFALVLLLFMSFYFPITNISYAQLAKSKSKFVGNIVSNGLSIRSDFTKYWNQVTAENAGKWSSVEGTQGGYNWTQLDSIYNYAVRNKFQYKHHALVWGQQYPSFVATVDSATLYQEIEDWIKNTGQRYTKADLVDVVNEPLHSFTGTALNLVKALGGTGTTGWDWVIKAFQLARKYWSPSTKLLINEYNVLNDASAAANYVKIINLLKAKGLIDGIGIQAHSFEVYSTATSTLKSNLDNIAATGLPIYISEFDINDSDDSIQLSKYQSIFPLLYEHSSVAGITLWGYVIYQTWQTNAYLINERNAERPALQWLRIYLASPYRPALISPNFTTGESLTPKLIWHSSAGATSYHVQISTLTSFATTVLDTTLKDTMMTCKPLTPGARFYWHISSIGSGGESPYSDAFIFLTKDAVVIEKIEGLSTDYKLLQNYPNPFNPSTLISYHIPAAGFVTLKVYDQLGREIVTLVNEYQNSGIYSVNFSGQHSQLPSGFYFYTLKAGSFVQTKKMMLLK